MTREEHISNLETIGCDGWTVTTEAYKSLQFAIKALEQEPKTGYWIPVSEGLPEDNGWYQCTVVLNDLPRTIALFYKSGEWLDDRKARLYDIYGYGDTTEKHKLSYQELIDWTRKVIAWMPLPEPYKVESEGMG